MVHAENGDAIDVIVKEAVADGKSDPIWHARTRPMETEAEATNRAIQLARVANAALYVVHVSCQPAVEPIAARPREGLGRLGRDLHAVPVRRRLGAREAGLGGREVHLHAAAAAEGGAGAPLEGAPERRALGRLDRPLPVQLAGPEGDQRPRLPGRPERRAGDREPAAHAARVRRPHRADHDEPLRRADVHERRQALRALPAQGHDRRRQRRRPGRLGSREVADDLGRDATTRTSTTTCSRARRSPAPRRSCSSAAR